MEGKHLMILALSAAVQRIRVIDSQCCCEMCASINPEGQNPCCQLTYSTEHSPSWEANWFLASQEIPSILWNPKVHFCIHKCPPPDPILCPERHEHDKWVPVTTVWCVLRLRMEERPPVWWVAEIILNKRLQTADMGWWTIMGVGRGANTTSP
jgi:hypothetical protein